MAGTPLKQAVIAALQARAIATLGEDATALDYVEDAIASGATILEIAKSLETDLGRPVSRQTVSLTVRGLAPDAPARIDAAQRVGASAHVEESIIIADEAAPTAGAAAQARVRVAARQWMGERRDPDSFKATPSVQVNLGGLMIDALRQPAPSRPESNPETAAPATENEL